MSRVILHCDCNNFFASVESVDHPEYRLVPMAVAGSVEDRHGIILAKNELAKKYGIKTAEPVVSAQRKCPNLLLVAPHYDKYLEYSKKVGEIHARYTDMIEPFGIDESWLDVTASRKLFGTGRQIAERIREEVKRELSITVSIGVSFNKVYAKLGSDYRKPDAVTVIDENNYKDIVYPLPVGDLLFIGSRTQEELMRVGIRTIGDLATASESLLERRFGKSGGMMHKYAAGLDDSPVSPLGEHEDAKSVGSGMTFRHNLTKPEEWQIGISHLAEDVAGRLRSASQKCSTVQLTVKDVYLRTVQRQRPIRPESDIGREIAAVALDILKSEWEPYRPIRSLTVTATGLVRADLVADQLDFFSDNDPQSRDRSKKREQTVDLIRHKFGSSAIVSGAIIGTDLGIKGPKDKGKYKTES